jgi:segregation and condensation protein A
VGYSVTTEPFRGPIDLLVHLVSTHEVDILEIPLASVVDEFVAVLRDDATNLDLETLSEFLLMAAILVEIKSTRLLPGPEDVDEDEEVAGWEQRDLLVARLLECRAYAGAADAFVALAEAAARSFPRQVGLDEGFVVHAPDLLAGVTALKLAKAFAKVTAAPVPSNLDLSHVTVDTVTVFEAVRELAAQLPLQKHTTFAELTAHLDSRIEVIVRFLALLELCKLGMVTLGQGMTFGELQISWLEGARPLASVGAGFAEVDDYDG